MKTPELNERQRRIRTLVQEYNSQGGVTVSQIITLLGLPTGTESAGSVRADLDFLNNMRLVNWVQGSGKWRSSKFIQDHKVGEEEGLIFAALGKAGSDGLTTGELLKQCKPASEARVRQVLRYMVDQGSAVAMSRSSYKLNNQAAPDESVFPLDKRIAAAVLDGMNIRDQSYNTDTHSHSVDDGTAFQRAFAKAGLPPTLWHVIYLANHWDNDLRGWAEDVLKGNTQELTVDQSLERCTQVYEAHKFCSGYIIDGKCNKCGTAPQTKIGRLVK